MKPKATIKDAAVAKVVKIKDSDHRPRIGTTWDWEHWRGGKKVDSWQETNVCVNEGLEHMLDVAFSSATQITTWYIALFEDDYTPLITNDYQAPGYTECTAYDETVRETWSEGGVSSKSISNSGNRAEFTMNATKTVYGASLVSEAHKGDVTSGEGVLFCSSQFATSKAVEDDDVLKVTVTLTAADA